MIGIKGGTHLKSIIIYYSYDGNTKRIANMIHDKTGYDIVEIKPVVPYTSDYQKLVDEEENKMHQEEVVEIEPISVDLNNYDAIILGTPIWWYTMTPPIRTFLKNNDLSGKVIVPFATNGGWLGSTFDDIKKYAPNSNILNPISIKFNGSDLAISQDELNEWILKL